jgi:hypothetical protein
MHRISTEVCGISIKSTIFAGVSYKTLTFRLCAIPDTNISQIVSGGDTLLNKLDTLKLI